MRIISGKYGSRKLKTLTGNNTRPTEDRVREAVFSRLGPYFNGGIILDLFAGSGAISLEALSRGFDFAYLVDVSKEAVSVIYSNISDLKVQDQTKVLNTSYKSALTKLKNLELQFDLIYLDPPYNKGIEKEALELITQYDLLKDDGTIVIETDKRTEPEINSPYILEKTATYGINRISYLRKEKADAESNLSRII
ncbi:MAG: 16S rRNA (guanine(966)-N(2))-methyltransferase RsmD [Erysipelotrichaceae bacterium]|jgi:16S rRNA (guanine966-N2)-methyltransferase|nr:16S rRNA (guanine(966)-N(2))-methyltransferase RsmD [Erysipelotrichaceae bacterium]